MRKKKIVTLILAGSLILALGSCGNKEKEPETTQSTTKNIETETKREEASYQEEETKEKEEKVEKEEKTIENTKSENTQKENSTFSFGDLRNVEFYFSSGAGGWATQMTISADGSFSGEYFDSDMGTIGENYPNGTMYWSDFNGQFTQPVKVNEYTYSMQIREIHYEKEVGTEEIKDGVLYYYVDAYGLDHANNILIYLPGAPVAELPEEFRNWIRGRLMDYSGSLDIENMELPFYALNNEVNQYGFSGYNMIDGLKERIIGIENFAEELEASIKNDVLTQADYNEKTGELYQLWDMALNEVWGVLKQTQDEETMRALTVEELEWIALKEQAVTEAGAEYEGGSMRPMIENQKAAEMTKDRVYKLMEYFN